MPVAQTRLENLQVCKLLQCVRDEDRDQIEKLTLHGVPHLINYNEPTVGDTALCIAAEANNVAMVTFLLELGAHPDVVDFQGRTPVMRAAHYGHTLCMKALGEAGANMTTRDLDGKGKISNFANHLYSEVSVVQFEISYKHCATKPLFNRYSSDDNQNVGSSIPVVSRWL